jgi:hypothetical protein
MDTMSTGIESFNRQVTLQEDTPGQTRILFHFNYKSYVILSFDGR